MAKSPAALFARDSAVDQDDMAKMRRRRDRDFLFPTLNTPTERLLGGVEPPFTDSCRVTGVGRGRVKTPKPIDSSTRARMWRYTL